MTGVSIPVTDLVGLSPLQAVVNGAAAGLFAVGSLAGFQDVSWPHAGVMAASAVAGGLAGSALARRLPAAWSCAKSSSARTGAPAPNSSPRTRQRSGGRAPNPGVRYRFRVTAPLLSETR